MTTVLVVDDVPAMGDQYAYDLRRLGGHETMVARSGEEALELLARESVDAVILDLEMPGIDGFTVLRTIRDRGLDVPVIVYTGTGNYDRCVQALRFGADGFIDKNEAMARVVREIETVLERRRLLGEVANLRARLGVDTSLAGSSAAMRTLRERIARLAPLPSAVLIEGESGTGKELVARDLHRLSGREDEPFIAINCAALPENLVESELFGHERGAFTGANQMRKGAFEAAGHGTLFLDEIGELPAPMQAKLLRVLEGNELARVGGNRSVPIHARVVAATNRSLDAEVQAGRFRQDLLFRLNVHTLTVPPLRDRLSDVPELAEFLLALLCRRLGMRGKRLAADAGPVLMRYDWRRNNVRELRNVLERMVIATQGEVLSADLIPAEVRALAAFRAATGWDAPPQRLTIDKRVPVAAGMGGGSGDAAAALRLASVAAGVDNTALLFELAARLGGDVPSQVAPGRTLMTGAGEHVRALPPVGNLALVILPSEHGLSTPAVYREFDRLAVQRAPEELAALEAQGGDAPVHNDLQDAARSLCPPIDEALAAVAATGADHVLVSGSGPTVFGLYGDPERARAAAAAVGGIAAEPVDAGFGAVREG